VEWGSWKFTKEAFSPWREQSKVLF
jgi:hypothetical protein